MTAADLSTLLLSVWRRKAALGFWQMAYQRYPNKDAITHRVQEIPSMFSTANVEERASLTHGLHIDYILVGPHERAPYPGVKARFEADPSHLEEAYAAGGVKIYACGPSLNTKTTWQRIQHLSVTRGQSKDYLLCPRRCAGQCSPAGSSDVRASGATRAS